MVIEPFWLEKILFIIFYFLDVLHIHVVFFQIFLVTLKVRIIRAFWLKKDRIILTLVNRNIRMKAISSIYY